MFGILGLSFWGYVVATIILTQVTIAGVTIYLHRHQTHRALDLHPIVSHFFRMWLWLTTGMVTKEWVSIHRQHHAATDVEGDPHSPKLLGLKKVLLEGAELYRQAANDTAMIDKYAHGTPNDWIERNLYSKYSKHGIFLMLGINLLLFGLPGITIWAIQMMWIPFHAAGVINGVGHYFGYRNFESQDTSHNIFPIGFWIGGEELHNNHHAYASSAKFSLKWWEFDLGWLYIQCLRFLGLAKVKKLPPKCVHNPKKSSIDIDTVRAVVVNRLQIMSQFYTMVIRPILRDEKQKNSSSLLKQATHIFKKGEHRLNNEAKLRLQTLLKQCERLRIVYNYRCMLQNVWLKAAKSQVELVEALQAWCKAAEESGLEVLRQFSMRLHGLTLVHG